MQQDTPGVELIISEVTDAIRRAFAEGYRRGSLEAVEKMTRAVGANIAPTNRPATQLPPQDDPRGRQRFSYGKIITAFRQVLLAGRDIGVSRQQLTEFCRSNGFDITNNQYRETMKRLTGGQEAVRHHGVYFPGPKLRADLVPPSDIPIILPTEILSGGDGLFGNEEGED